MFSHRQHLNTHGASRLPQSLISPVHSSHPQTQHETNSNVTGLHFPGATGHAATSAAKPCMGIKHTWGSKPLQTEGRGWLGGSGNGIECLSSGQKPSPGEQHLQSRFTQGLHRSQQEMSKWLQSSPLQTSVRQLVTPTLGTMGQPPERHQRQACATSVLPFSHG